MLYLPVNAPQAPICNTPPLFCQPRLFDKGLSLYPIHPALSDMRCQNDPRMPMAISLVIQDYIHHQARRNYIHAVLHFYTGEYWILVTIFLSPIASLIFGAVALLRSFLSNSNNREKTLAGLSILFALFSIVYITLKITWFGVLLSLSGHI